MVLCRAITKGPFGQFWIRNNMKDVVQRNFG